MREPNVTRLARQGLLVVVALVVSSTLALGATYYVRPDGSDANSGLTNDPAGAWRTIDHAADTVSPGDVVRIQPGTYSERVTPSRDGSYDAPITFVADGAVTVCGWDMASRHYIRIIGFVIDTNAGGCSISLGAVGIAGTSSHLEFWNNVFRDATYNGIRTGIFDVTTNSLVIGNTFHSFGIGNPSGIAVNLRGNHNLFAYNEIHSVNPDAFVLAGTHNRWLNNYTHNLMETYGGHSDVFQAGSNTLGLSYNLFEANFQSGSGSLGDEHTAIIQNLQPELCSGTCGEMKENIFRRNVFHNVSNCVMGIAYATVAPISQTRYYHNTTASAHRNSLNATAAQYFYSGVTDTYFFNNIEFESWGTSTTVAGHIGRFQPRLRPQ